MIYPSEAKTYAEWMAAVKAMGGRPTTMPDFKAAVQTTSRPAAAYDMAVWVPKVNAGAWSQPDGYSPNGQTAYYLAPEAVQKDAARLRVASPAETAAGAKVLQQDWYSKLETLLGKTGLIVAGGVVVVWLLSRRK